MSHYYRVFQTASHRQSTLQWDHLGLHTRQLRPISTNKSGLADRFARKYGWGAFCRVWGNNSFLWEDSTVMASDQWPGAFLS